MTTRNKNFRKQNLQAESMSTCWSTPSVGSHYILDFKNFIHTTAPYCTHLCQIFLHSAKKKVDTHQSCLNNFSPFTPFSHTLSHLPHSVFLNSKYSWHHLSSPTSTTRRCTLAFIALLVKQVSSILFIRVISERSY